MNALLEKYYSIRNEHDSILSQLDDEVIRIIKAICKGFKRKYDWWSYACYDGDEQPLPRKVSHGVFEININGPTLLTDKYEYNSGFPVEFFDMTSGQIEEYIKNEIEEERKKEEAAIKKSEEAELRKQQRELLKKKNLDKVLSKLTLTDRKVLGYK